MKTRLWLNVALAAVVVALALFAYFKPQGGEPEHKLSALKTAEADRIKIEIAGAAPIEAERVASDWRLTAPVRARADNSQVQRLLGILEATSKDRLTAGELARFDLNEPHTRLTINRQSFSFGAVNQLSQEQYVLTEDGIYLISLRYGAALPTSALQLVSKQLFTADEAPVGFEFKDFKLAQQDGKWQLTPSADAGADDINRWVDEWRLAAALDVQAPSERQPLATIKVQFKNGTDIALAVLQREPALVLARSDQPFEYEFSNAAAKRLLAPPAVVNGNTSEANETVDKRR